MNRIVTIGIVIVVIVVIVAGGLIASGVFSTHTTASTTSSTTSPTTSTSSTSSTSSSTSSSSSLSTSSSTTSSSTGLSCAGSSVTIGYYDNINHGPALIGLFNGSSTVSSTAFFQSILGPTCTIKTDLFTSGPTEMTALLSGAIQFAFVGPSPAVSTFINDNQAVRIVSGVASGGAVFVVEDSSGITNATASGGIATLNGKSFCAPSLGNTQDVSLRTYLNENKVSYSVDDTSNGNILTLLGENSTSCAGAWLPQPYAALALAEYKVHVFLNEQSLWPGGNFSTAELAVATSYLTAHPDVVQKIVLANVESTLWINSHLYQAALLMNSTIYSQSTLGLSSAVLNSSLATLNFTYDPLESSVQVQTNHAYALGFIGSNDTSGLFDLTYLNDALTQLGLPNVTS